MGLQLSSFLNRHRRKMFIIGGVAVSAAVLNAYMRRKFCEWEKKQTIEYMNQIKKQTHFDGTIQVCDSALLSFMPQVRDIILKNINIDPIVEELKDKPPNKLELWNELKVMVFTQVVAEMYAQCLIVILLRVQTCIFSGYTYANCQKCKNSESTSSENMKYLSYISNFLVGGIKDLIIPVEDAVRKALRGITLSDELKLGDFCLIFRNITENMSQGGPCAIPNIAQYLMLHDCKDQNENNSVLYDAVFGKIVCETQDVLECSDFQKVLSCSIEKGIAMLMDRVSECYMHITSDEDSFSNPHNVSAPLAKMIPVLHTVFVSHKPNEQGSLVYVLLQQDVLKTFVANLYEAFSQEVV